MEKKEQVEAQALPRGTIIMYHGQTSDIPSGWLLCDGTKGTPDLRGRFVLGAGKGNGLTQRDADRMGGDEKHTLTVAEIPDHGHGPGSLCDISGTHGSCRPFTVPSSFTITPGQGGRGATPHDIMPPFHTLQFLMKD